MDQKGQLKAKTVSRCLQSVHLTLVCTEPGESSESVTQFEGREAVAQFDFEGRTRRELTFKKGDVITLLHRKSVDWWEGSLRGKQGLIPDKYLKIMTSATSRAR